jgi:hypothetical protein
MAWRVGWNKDSWQQRTTPQREPNDIEIITGELCRLAGFGHLLQTDLDKQEVCTPGQSLLAVRTSPP